MKSLKHLAASALTLLLLAPTVAAAADGPSDQDSAQVAVNGRVARLCILGEPSRPVVDLGQMAQTSGANVGRISALPVQTVTLPSSFCNFAGSVVSVTANALVGDAAGTPPTGFANAVNYTATASGWGDAVASATTNAAADGSDGESFAFSGTQADPRLADIDLQLATYSVPGNALLIAGGYTGQVTVTLGPVPISE